MPELLMLVGGALLIGLAMVDMLWTTLAIGGGPLQKRLSQWLWRGMLRFHRWRSSHQMLSFSGTVILLAAPMVWILMVWGGWTLVFSAQPTAVVHADTGAAPGVAGRIYFAGYTIFTLGIGNYVPQEGLWEVLTAMASLNGLFLITLAVTYLVPVLSAAVKKRQLAALIFGLGETPNAILRNAWDGASFAALNDHLAQFALLVEQHMQQHLAYPVLHYFHSASARSAASLNLAMLDEALLLMRHGVAPEGRLPQAATEPLRRAIDDLLRILGEHYLFLQEDPPPPPRLDELEAAGIPVVDDEAFAEALEAHAQRRRLLRSFVEQDGWEWGDVYYTVPFLTSRKVVFE